MLWLQVSSLAVAILGPLAVWAVQRHRPHSPVARLFARGLAALLIAVFAAGLGQKYLAGEFDAARALPMQLCDWTLFAVVAALLWRWPWCFELGYFWGLCGTLQALFTPAIGRDLGFLRQLVFFLDHAGIVAGVLFLLLVAKMRPRHFGRVLVFSEIYLATALAVNALTGANYGFLAHKPEQASLLDFFSTEHWTYVAQINLTALCFFSLAYAPWLLAQQGATPRSRPPAGAPGAG
jgi:hypothetical integral membrane protein (TIGR02206 family)